MAKSNRTPRCQGAVPSCPTSRIIRSLVGAAYGRTASIHTHLPPITSRCRIGALLSTDQIGSDEDVVELLDGEIANPTRFGEALAALRDFVAEIDKSRTPEVQS